ncbi:aspartyl/asparaginyl beta-hydroxylase domain-containing protein [Kineosporia babensis]|uniref:Aspartyl/asparaginyl beta-hydroxylase domain-containing protein n=1 Tax=Kineosporia babensis TaxID=499548 RepID=A0A9X1NMG4_9ACTN|nr:aspartyl/asparaginyl beta-hydroxylase domain-containing protein [Kineosporia babensis]MCD5315798.1 aspartyl/asparaginyl beta-hydroxylase domain-containing protein [Kineosporia babensis]
MSTYAATRLALDLDARRLQDELSGVTGHTWDLQRSHTVHGISEPAVIDWRILPLHSPGGDSERTDPGGPGCEPFAPTFWLGQLPYLAQVLESIPAPRNAARLMALGPGAVIAPHRDLKHQLDRGFMRLHIPIVTTPEAVLTLDGVEHCWQPGTFWYGDFSREHSVRNTSTTTRVHAVIDVLLTPELTRLFPDSWQDLLHSDQVLLNHYTSKVPRDRPHSSAVDCLVPTQFIDFQSDDSLEGSLVPAQIKHTEGSLSLTVDDRILALVPAGADGEWRFSGWSEQRTVQVVSSGALLLRTRQGGKVSERLVHVVPDDGPVDVVFEGAGSVCA